MASILPAALTLLGLYGAYCGLLFALQRHLVFPRAQVRDRPALVQADLEPEVVWLQTGFGPVESWLFAPRAGGAGALAGQAAPAIIIAHGNAERIDYLPAPFLRFADLGLAVMLVEYPGYGRSAGSPTQATVTRTFAAAYDTLAARPGIDRSRILAFGRSLGGAAACALAAERPLAGLILQSTFTDLRAMAHRFLAPGFLVRDPFDNLSAVRSFAGPVLVLHGTQDGLIPHRHGERLAAAARRGRLVSYPCGHNDCPPDWETLWRDVEDFLDEAGLRPPPP